MYSDNGPNFHGADRELQTSFQAMRTDSILQAGLANDGVQWHFIPLAAPHFGELWEAGVKKLKFHLRRVIAHALQGQIRNATLSDRGLFEFSTNRGPYRRSERLVRFNAGPFFDWPAAYCCTRRLHP